MSQVVWPLETPLCTHERMRASEPNGVVALEEAILTPQAPLQGPKTTL